MKKNLILTILHRYQYPVVEPFINSLRETGYDGELVIFASDSISKATKRRLKKANAKLIDFNTTYPFLKDHDHLFDDITPSVSINNYRFLLYLKYLQENPGRYENIMLTDIRDVIFQHNIFDDIENNKIYFFLEDESEVFRTSTMNYDWCLNANGPEVTESIIDKNVSCAGIVIGGYQPVVDYLTYMRSRFVSRPDLHWGLDQGIHNAYVYTKPNDAAMLIKNTSPFVLTLGACRGYDQNGKGCLVTKTGATYPVVHQYDRFGALIVYFKKKHLGNYPIQVLKKLVYQILP